MLKLIRTGCVSLLLFFMPQSLYAAVEDSSICDESITRAAQESTGSSGCADENRAPRVRP
jgi:hypothetical protein